MTQGASNRLQRGNRNCPTNHSQFQFRENSYCFLTGAHDGPGALAQAGLVGIHQLYSMPELQRMLTEAEAAFSGTNGSGGTWLAWHVLTKDGQLQLSVMKPQPMRRRVAGPTMAVVAGLVTPKGSSKVLSSSRAISSRLAATPGAASGGAASSGAAASGVAGAAPSSKRVAMASRASKRRAVTAAGECPEGPSSPAGSAHRSGRRK